MALFSNYQFGSNPNHDQGILALLQGMQAQPNGGMMPQTAQQPAPGSWPESPSSNYMMGQTQVPLYGQAPEQPQVSAQARAPQQQAPAAPAAQQPTQQGGFGAAMEGFIDNLHTGGIGPIVGAMARGMGMSSNNVTERALMARGLDAATAKAAARSPQILQAVLPNLFGTRKGEVVNNRLVDPTTGRVIADFSDAAKPIALGSDQRLVNPMTGQQVAGPAQIAKFDDISGMRKEITGLPEVKRYTEALPIFRSMMQSSAKDSAAADLDFVYGVARIFDPDSVVREGEMKLVGQAQSIPEDIKGFIKRAAMGEGRLTPEARQRILEVANTRISELKGSYDQRTDAYKGIAGRFNIRSEDVLPQIPELPQLPKIPTVTGQPTRAEIEAELRRRGKLPK